MSSNPNWQDPNRNISTSQIDQRTFDTDNDAVRVNVVEPIELKVEDIQIGAVEIKDDLTDTRVNVVPVGGANAILTRNVIEQTKTSVNAFGSGLIAPSATITLATYTVGLGMSFTFTGGIVGGDEAGEFHFEVGGSDLALVRNSGAQRTIVIKFPEPQTAGAASIINIKAKNIGDKTKQFEATLSGYIIPA